MAKKKVASKVRALSVTVGAQATPSTPMYYANHAEVSHSRHEFVLSLVRVPTKFPPAQVAGLVKGETLLLEPEAQVTIPPTLLRPLIKALESQIQRYEEKFGKVAVKGSKDGDK